MTTTEQTQLDRIEEMLRQLMQLGPFRPDPMADKAAVLATGGPGELKKYYKAEADRRADHAKL
jgi:hypothetical protein